MGPLGGQEIVVIFLLALLLFGPKKLPELARTLGKALSEFRRAKNELRATFESHMYELEKEARLEASSVHTSPEPAAVPFPYPYDETGRHEADSEPAALPAPEETNTASVPETAAVHDTVARRNGGVHAQDAAPTAEEERLA